MARRERHQLRTGGDSTLQTALPREYQEYNELAESDGQPGILVHNRKDAADNYPGGGNQLNFDDDNTDMELTNEVMAQ